MRFKEGEIEFVEINGFDWDEKIVGLLRLSWLAKNLNIKDNVGWFPNN
ncbi:hypothetical protein [Pedobacter frigoris]|nr:hypothetical protein [Pedobacter frigoris]